MEDATATETGPRLAALRGRLERRRNVRDLRVALPGAAAAYHLAAPADPDAVLDEVAEQYSAATAAHAGRAKAPNGRAVAEPHMPYWAMPWASGLALGEVVLARRDSLTGRTAAELGCGLGTTASAALAAGVHLVAVDCFGETLTYCRYNGLRNTGREPETLLADWRTDAGRQRLIGRGPFDVVLAADVLYEREDVAPLLELVPDLLRPHGQFWLGEPGRATSELFVQRAAERGWKSEVLAIERDWPGETGHARVRVHVYAF